VYTPFICKQKNVRTGSDALIMIDWTNILEESTLKWLLEEVNPSVRYFALRDILEKREDDQEVISAKETIFNSELVTKILTKQNSDGSWEKTSDPYLPKYKASYWQIMLLGQLGLDKADIRVEKACEYIFKFQQKEGSFISQTPETLVKEYESRVKKGRKLPPRDEWVSSTTFEQQLSCLTGNMVAALIRLGYQHDNRVKKALTWLIQIQNRDGGWLCPYWRAHVKDKHGCLHGTICALEAFSEVKQDNQTEQIEVAVEKGAEFLLMHRLFKADHHGYKTINPAWLLLGFPWFYGYNILRGLDVLTKLGYVNDGRLEDAVKLLLQKGQNNGAWILENTPAGRMYTNVEKKGKPSKWITLIALRVLKRLNSVGS